MSIQRETPNIKGFGPTDFRVLNDSPEPIKKRVIVIPFLESMPMKAVIFWGRLKTVFATMAKMKKRINQGVFILDSFCLKKKVVAIDIGIIQRARVSFTVVAISSDLAP